MAEREDAEREFERVFGKAQKSPERDPSKSELINAPTQKLPSDSDVLGIRTDSDRFIFKNPIPERLPIEPTAAKSSSDPLSPNKGNDVPAQEAMTIALNVNVFANIPKQGEEKNPGDLSSVTWTEATQLFVRKPGEAPTAADGPTFAISIPKEQLKPGTDIFNFPSPLTQGAKQNEDFARASGTNSASSSTGEPAPTAKFTRIMHVQDSVTLPQPQAPVPSQNPSTPTAFADPLSNPSATTTSGPSDFTRIVKGSELRALQEKFAATSGTSATPEQSTWPAPPSGGPSLPAGMATQIWSASSSQTQRLATQHAQPWPTQNTTLPPIPKPPEPPAAEPSKLSQYLPLILVLNLLFLLAILLIVFFAVKK